MRSPIVLSGAFIAACLLISCGDADLSENGPSWPVFRGPERNGIARESEWDPQSLQGEPSILWQAKIGRGFSQAVIQGKRLYITGQDMKDEEGYADVVYCIDVAHGKILWTFSYPCAPVTYVGPRSTPTVDGGNLFVLGMEGQLFCLDRATGRKKWERHLVWDFGAVDPPFSFSSSIIVRDNMLVINAMAAGIVLDKRDGSLIWKTRALMCGYSTPVLFDYRGKACAVMTGYDAITAVELGDGKTVWSIPWEDKFNSNIIDPIVTGDKLFISNWKSGSALFDISGDAPRLVWHNPDVHGMFHNFILHNGFVYGITITDKDASNGKLVCISIEDGSVKWEYDRFGPLLMVNDDLVFLEKTGALHVIEATPEGFREVASSRLPKAFHYTDPVAAGGRMYVRNYSGVLFCMDVTGG